MTQISIATKYALAGQVLQADNVGSHSEGFTAVYELSGTGSGEGPDHKLHCLAILHGAAGEVAGENGYCVETDPDGDQVLWKTTPTPHAMSATKDLEGVWETLLGTGKYTGVSITTKVTCQQTATGLRSFKLACDVTR